MTIRNDNDLLRRLVEEPKRDFLSILNDALGVIVVLVLVLALYSWTQARDLADKLETQHKVTARYSGMLAECLNGKTLYDKTSNTAFFCARAVAVNLNN